MEIHASMLGDIGESGEWCLNDRFLGSLDNPFIGTGLGLCVKQTFQVILG